MPILLGCGAGDDASPRAADGGAKRADAASQCYGANDCPPGHACNEYHTCVPFAPKGDALKMTDAGSLPPEVENAAEPPASGKQYVYVAVAEQDMVAKIDSVTLQVRSVKVGNDPGALRTVPGQDVVVVLNRLSATASILRSKTDGSDDIVTLKTVAGLNQLALAPGGKHGVAYFDLAATAGKMPTTQPFQEVTLLVLEAGKEAAIDLPVGFRPSSVQFTADGSRAFVITEQGVSIVDFAKVTKSIIVPTIPLLKDPLKEVKPAEVVITPDGKLALLRQPGVKGIRAVDLETKAITDLPLASDATDLDLTRDGSLAVVVLREGNEVDLVDIPGDLGDPTKIDKLSTTGYTAGQVELTPDGKHAFLFSNATTQEVLLVADLVTRTITAHQLKKGVRAVRVSPKGNTAIVIHNKLPGTPGPADGVEVFLDKSWGYSLFSLDSGFPKLQLTEADPGATAFAPDSSSAYLLLNDAAKHVRAVEAISLESFLVERVVVGSPPMAVGVVPSTGRVYVAQNHPLGRVTFIDMSTHATKTVTGFELNSYVIE